METGSAREALDEMKRQFVRDEFHGLTLAATMQRSRVYANGLSSAQRAPLQLTMRNALDTLADQYVSEVDDVKHGENIASLADGISQAHSKVLRGGVFRIGPAQKALNLFLKYLWCSGQIGMPPHCPFDRAIMTLLEPSARCNWTEIRSLSRYEQVVKAAHKKAKGVPLAEWELGLYNEVSVSGKGRAQKK